VLAARQGLQRPPVPASKLPFLGHAIGYKKDPPGYLQEQRDALGTCFQLDLAGLPTTVVMSRFEMAQVANASSDTLSSVAAVADFGFRETLGPLNVHAGTVLKACGSRLTDGLRDSVLAALQEFGESGALRDAMFTLRRVTLHATVLHLIGKPILDEYCQDRDFLSDFMIFQDHVEDATAKGVVLPEWIATRFIWRPVRLERARIVARLQHALEVVGSGEKLGLWLNSCPF